MHILTTVNVDLSRLIEKEKCSRFALKKQEEVKNCANRDVQITAEL